MRTDRMSVAHDREQWSRRANEIRARVPVSAVVGRVVTLKKAGPEWKGLCPFHNERTPSFTVNDRKQFFHCFGCGHHGDAIAFVIARQGLEFKAAVELLESENGLRHLQASRAAPPPPKAAQREDVDKARRILRTWAECRHDPVVDRYLKGRHLVPPSRYGLGDPGVNGGWPDDLKFHPALWHGPSKQALPAMVMPYRDIATGEVKALHRTYLKVTGVGVTKAGTGQDKMHWGPRKGCLLLLGPFSDTMGGGEGIETSLSGQQLFRVPALCFGSADAMAEIELPFIVGRFTYWADWNARTRTGERSASQGKKLNAVGRTIAIAVPNLRSRDKADFNDVLAEKAKLAAIESPIARALASQRARGLIHAVTP